ncbi:MAG: DUF72 domain-containing protein [Deltaproteobacteria bacterium]
MEYYLGCSGWNYGDIPEKGGWINIFYPNKQSKRLRYYSEFFNTVEMDSTFYEEFYSKMTKGLFFGMVKATPQNFEFSIKVPERITHRKKLDITKDVIFDFKEFLDKISPLYNSGKLGAILIQLPPSFSIEYFNILEKFLENIPRKPENNIINNTIKKANNDYQYAIEFRHPSWNTEGPWELLKHHNIANVITDSPEKENLSFLSNSLVTSADHSFIRFHGRNTSTGHYWYNYLYTKKELEPWVHKVRKLKNQTKKLRIYFNNHYGGKAIINALQFKEMSGLSLNDKERKILQNGEEYYHYH